MTETPLLPASPTGAAVPLGAVRRTTGLRRYLDGRRVQAFLHDRVGMTAAIFLLLVALIAIFAGKVAPYDPVQTDLSAIFRGISRQHLLGTDELGRDVLSRVIFGTRVSVVVGLLSVSVALLIALPFGLLAGYHGKLVDTLVVAIVDIILSVPPLVLVFAIAGILGASITNVVIALAVFFTPVLVRVTRTETMHVRHSQLVEAEMAIGVRTRTILLRHVLPNIAPALIVQCALNIGIAIIAEAGLSFLGLGVRPPTASWGGMLNSAYQYMVAHPWQIVPPGLAIVLTVVAWNLVADALRSTLDQR
jgi:peptide/nickel transport system permease protein